ncbi:hypothetical protein [Brazilian marseillevirus]|uniref:hypothetical protein n=1 Tax=Brazilian marseillevirus TaxID=1813599 RepID=UPI00078176E3|nr:hypothetical protein A3303_gp452 [Brazilian marseillevirus]AMQ10960.1 hypothetical protein [Brazilian marseillevirus]
MNNRNSVQLVASRSGESWKLLIIQGQKKQKNFVVYFESYNYVLVAQELFASFQCEGCPFGELDGVADDFHESAIEILKRHNKKDVKPFKKALAKLEELPATELGNETRKNLKSMKKFLELEYSLGIIKTRRRDEREL